MFLSAFPNNCVSHVAKCLWRSERVFNPLQMELKMLVSHHVGAGTVPGPPAKATSGPCPLGSLSSPKD